MRYHNAILLFFGTRAAFLDTVLGGVLERRDDFHERRLHFSVRVDFFEARGGFQSAFSAFSTTFATTLFVFDVTGRFRALQFALRARAGGRFGARPRARRLLAERSAIGFRGDTRGVTLSRGANGLAFRARVFFTHVFRATDRALRLLAVDSAFSAFRLLALHLTFGARAHRVANSRARRVIALPATSGVAIFLSFLLRVDFRVDFGGVHSGNSQ